MKPTYEQLEQQVLDMAVQLANAESKCRELQRDNDSLEAVAVSMRYDMRDTREKLEAAERRIAELETKIETADKLQDSAFRHGLQHGFSYGHTNDQAGYEQCLKSYSSRGKDNG